MLPLTADEWLDTSSSHQDIENDAFFLTSPSKIRRRLRPRSETGSQSGLTAGNLAKFGDLQKIASAGGDVDDTVTEAEDLGERRRLGGFEQFFSTYVPYGLGLIYYIVDFEGPPDTQLLKESMRLQVKRHPNLRSRIVHNDALECFNFEDCPEIRVPQVTSEDVVGYTEKRMRNAHQIKAGKDLYLWSLAMHHTPSSQKNELILLIHHAISDGDSILKMLQSLIEGMALLAPLSHAERRTKLREVECLPQLPSADTQLYPLYNGYYMLYHFRVLFRELWKVIIQPKIPGYARYTRGPQERTTRISSFTLSAPDFKRLLGACKAHKTSVTGAITAACLQTMEKFIAGDKYLLKAEILVNFRNYVASHVPGAAEAHQLYAAPMDVLTQGGSTPETCLDFWHTARNIKGQLDDYLGNPASATETLDFFYVLGHHPISLPLFRLFSASWKQGRQKCVSISNLGMTDKLFQQKGPWKLGRMQMGIDELLFGHSVFVALASHEGCLNLTLSYIEPIFTRSMVVEYGQGVVHSLITACEDAPPMPSVAASAGPLHVPAPLAGVERENSEGEKGGSGDEGQKGKLKSEEMQTRNTEGGAGGQCPGKDAMPGGA